MTTEIPKIFAILNVTPDSFSDGGQFSSSEEAVARGIQLFEDGADYVDVGGESTRPGAQRVPVEEEQQRILPVVRGLVAANVPVSVDTMNADTAVAAAELGAAIINDVSGGLADSFMRRVIPASDVDYIAMHWRGHSENMDDAADYDDVVTDVKGELMDRLAELTEAGMDPSRVIVDPGLGFAKTAEHNWQLLGRLNELSDLRCRIMIGASRKRFLGQFADDDAPTSDRDFPTAVVSALAAEAGVWAVRVHDVKETATALAVWQAVEAGRSTRTPATSTPST